MSKQNNNTIISLSFGALAMLFLAAIWPCDNKPLAHVSSSQITSPEQQLQRKLQIIQSTASASCESGTIWMADACKKPFRDLEKKVLEDYLNNKPIEQQTPDVQQLQRNTGEGDKTITINIQRDSSHSLAN